MSSLKLFLFMYADNIVLFSESVEGLQGLLDELLRYCNKWKLCVNVDKSKIVTFRNSGKLRSNEKWHIGDEVLETVEQFTYLGIIFNYNNNFTKAEKKLSEQARKAFFFALKKNISDMSFNNETLLSLFDRYIRVYM